MKSVQQLLAPLAHSRDPGEVFKSFVRMGACALAHQTREEEYLAEAGKFNRAELDAIAHAFGQLVMDMEAHPYEDLLGPVHMELLGKRGQQWRGEFHTPGPVCKLMARLTAGGPGSYPASGPIRLCEPACGAGAMILAFAESLPPEARLRLQVTAIDINATACDMTFINCSLWGLAARIHHGDALRMEFWHAWSTWRARGRWASEGLTVPAQGDPPDVHEATALRRAMASFEQNYNPRKKP